MEDLNFGDILREARERSGEDLVSVARKLRIRPDILERIEASDLKNMPPRGYSRNMINAYARYLGLNSTNVVKNYLDAQYRSQVESARKNIRPTGFDMSGAKRHHGLREEVHVDERSKARAAAAERVSRAESEEDEYAAIQAESSRNRAKRLGLSSTRGDRSSRNSSRPSQARSHGGSSFDEGLFDDIDRGAEGSRELSSAERAIASRPASASHSRRAGAVHVGSYNGYGQGLYYHTRQQQASSDDAGRTRRLDDAPERPSSRRSNPAAPGSTRRLRRGEEEQKDTYMPRQSRRSALPEEHSISVYAAPRNLGTNQGGLRDKLPFLIAGVIILLLVVVIAFLANGIGSKATSSAQQSAPMNITGLPETGTSGSSSNDSSSSSSESSDDSTKQQATTKKTETAPTKTTIAYSVASGKTPYVEIYDGETCVVAQSLSGGSSDSYDVTDSLTIVASPYDGLTITQDGQAVDLSQYVNNGILRFEVNFADVLAAWNEAHPDSATASASTSASTTGTTSAQSSGSTTGSTATSTSTANTASTAQ